MHAIILKFWRLHGIILNFWRSRPAKFEENQKLRLNPETIILNFCSPEELFLKFDTPDPQKLRRNRIMLNYYVNVFFKTNTLSEHFVTLSAERCPFPAWFPTSKNSISATFSPIFLCLSAPAFFPFRWHLRTRHPPSKSPAFPPFIFSFRGDPSQPPSPQQFPLSSSLSERPTGRIYTKNQTVPFKIRAFPGRIITCTR